MTYNLLLQQYMLLTPEPYLQPFRDFFKKILLQEEHFHVINHKKISGSYILREHHPHLPQHLHLDTWTISIKTLLKIFPVKL